MRYVSLPLLLNILVLGLSFYLSIGISRGRISWQKARSIQMGILILDVALVVVNIIYGNWLFAILWGLVLVSNLYSTGILR